MKATRVMDALVAFAFWWPFASHHQSLIQNLLLTKEPTVKIRLCLPAGKEQVCEQPPTKVPGTTDAENRL